MPASLSEMTARMDQRKQRLQQEQQKLDRLEKFYGQNADTMSEPSELESSRQAPEPKRRHHRSSTKSPFEDDSSMQFDNSDTKSSATTPSTTPRQPNKFLKKTPAASIIPEKISVTRSPRDVSSPRSATKRDYGAKVAPPPSSASVGLLGQSSILARAAHRDQLYSKGLELAPGVFDGDSDDDQSSSEATSTSGSKNLFQVGAKSFLKKSATNTAAHHQVPELQHLDSETNSIERDPKKSKQKKNTRSASVIDTEDDSSLDYIGDGSSSEGRKTPTFTPRKGILKSPKDFIPRDNEYSVQFSERLVTVQTDDEPAPTPGRISRSTTPRRVQIVQNPTMKSAEVISSDTESISTAIDDDIQSDEHISQSPVDNMFANLILNDAPLITPAVEKKSPRSTNKKRPASPRKSHQRSVSDISDNDVSRAEEIPEEISTANYSEDFSLVPTETSTPRPKPSRIEKQPQTTRQVSTDDQQVQVDLTSAPFQSSLNQVHSIYLINQDDLNEVRPSLLMRSMVEPHVLQSLMTTNPVLLAVDDLIREQSSLLRSFIHLQRTYYESTVRSIQPDHLYVTKDNTLRYIADQQRSRIPFPSSHDAINRR